MSNIVRGGARWKRNKHSPDSTDPPIQILPVASAYGTALYRGDFVKVLSDGTIAACSAGDTIYGVVSHVPQYYDGTVVRAGGSLPASTTWGSVIGRESLVAVIPVRGQIFSLCADDGTTAVTQATFESYVQENVEWVAGTHVGDQSGTLADISTHATTNTLSLRIENIPNKNFQDFTSTGVELEVSVNLVQDVGSGSTTGT